VGAIFLLAIICRPSLLASVARDVVSSPLAAAVTALRWLCGCGREWPGQSKSGFAAALFGSLVRDRPVRVCRALIFPRVPHQTKGRLVAFLRRKASIGRPHRRKIGGGISTPAANGQRPLRLSLHLSRLLARLSQSLTFTHWIERPFKNAGVKEALDEASSNHFSS